MGIQPCKGAGGGSHRLSESFPRSVVNYDFNYFSAAHTDPECYEKLLQFVSKTGSTLKCQISFHSFLFTTVLSVVKHNKLVEQLIYGQTVLLWIGLYKYSVNWNEEYSHFNNIMFRPLEEVMEEDGGVSTPADLTNGWVTYNVYSK